MIVTLTANPSVDSTVELSAPLLHGEVQAVASTHNQAAGKGVNISRAATIAGLDTVAILPAPAHDPFLDQLAAAGIGCEPVTCSTGIRVNLTITDPDGTTTKLNAAGAPLGAEVLDRLKTTLTAAAAGADWVVMAGSLPDQTPPEWYVEVIASVRATGARIAVDTSGAPLRSVAAACALDPGMAPHLLKPNAEELADLLDLDPAGLEQSPAATAAASRQLVDNGVEAVLATLGGAGAVLTTAEGSWFATPPPIRVISTVGAGDSSLFGYLLAHLRGADPAQRLAWAVAYGSAAASLPGTTIPHPDQVRPDLVIPQRLESRGNSTVTHG